jgi:hypothetical protein
MPVGRFLAIVPIIILELELVLVLALLKADEVFNAESLGTGRAKLRLSRGFSRCPAPRRNPP